jgi:hypothetical protein
VDWNERDAECERKKKWLAKNAKNAKENLRVRAGLLVTVMSPLPGGMVGVFRVPTGRCRDAYQLPDIRGVFRLLRAREGVRDQH